MHTNRGRKTANIGAQGIGEKFSPDLFARTVRLPRPGWHVVLRAGFAFLIGCFAASCDFPGEEQRGEPAEPVFAVGEQADISWSEALKKGLIAPVAPSEKLTEAARLFYEERIKLSGGESEFGLVPVILIPDVAAVADASGTSHESLVMLFRGIRDRDPSYLGIGAWSFSYLSEANLSNMVVEFSILAPPGVRDLSLVLIDANGKSRGWFMPEPEPVWADYVIDPSKLSAQGKFTSFKGDPGFDITRVVKIRLDESVRGATFFRDENPVTGSPIAWNAWNDLRVRPQSEIKPTVSCLKPLLQYKLSGTDCVYRRGAKNHFSVEMAVPPGSKSPKLRITDPGKPSGSTTLTVTGPVMSGGKAVFDLAVPASNPVGVYRVTGEVTSGSAQVLSTGLPVSIIFDVPPSMSANAAAVAAYLYDETGHREEGSYNFSNRYGTSVIKQIGANIHSWSPIWPERSYVLNPFSKNLFGMAIRAVHGETDEAKTAKNLMHAISNIIFYTSPNSLNNAEKMLTGALDATSFRDSYGPGGTEKQYIKGQCLDYANSLTAVLRSIGIPARVATKIESFGFAYHQWTEVYLEAPPSGTDKWYAFDAMDYTSQHTVTNDLTSSPVGQAERSKSPFGSSAFEILVGDESWTLGGNVQIKETQASPNKRIGLRRGNGASDALFEKCEQNHYSSTNCPDIDPDGTDLLEVSLDRDTYRVGDLVTATVEVRNPDPSEQPFELRFRYYRMHALDDGRTAFGDPVLNTVGSGIAGETLFETAETVRVLGGRTAGRQYSFKVPHTNLPADQYWVEAHVSSESGDDLYRVDVPVKTAYDLDIQFDPDRPKFGEDVVASVRIKNRSELLLTGLKAEIEVAEFFSIFDAPIQKVAELAPGESADLKWRLSPVRREVPALQHFRFLIRSDNGGNLAVQLPLRLSQPKRP